MRPKAHFHFKDVDEFRITNRFIDWLQSTSKTYQKDISLQYIFCSDDSLLTINQEFLDHDTYTDIITFDLSTLEDKIEGEIYISIDRVKDNAKQVGCSFTHELARVMSHGVFHLLGFADKKDHEALKMRSLEGGAIDFIMNVSRETNQK